MNFRTLGINSGINRAIKGQGSNAGKEKHRIAMQCLRGDPGGIRTPDTWFRRTRCLPLSQICTSVDASVSAVILFGLYWLLLFNRPLVVTVVVKVTSHATSARCSEHWPVPERKVTLQVTFVAEGAENRAILRCYHCKESIY